MKIINASYEILRPKITVDAKDAEFQAIEGAGRTCYKSGEKITPESAVRFTEKIIGLNHEAMLEHAFMSVRFIVDRGISHEIVRHRMASFAQESTRYCNYSKDKFGNELTFIKPCFFEEGSTAYNCWEKVCQNAEDMYMSMIHMGLKPEEARCILPHSLKTELVMTANMREWRHFFRLRAAGETGRPHPQMLEVAVPLLKEVKAFMPELFEDIESMEVEEWGRF